MLAYIVLSQALKGANDLASVDRLPAEEVLAIPKRVAGPWASGPRVGGAQAQGLHAGLGMKVYMVGRGLGSR